jgi:glycosyltransferase involved in cell wall biosynthesis
MNILHTVEFYSPSVGGAQEVVRQLSERLAARGHNVTVATTRLPERRSRQINGVKIEEFDISGNAVRGMRGEVDRYQKFLLEGKFDVMMNYAAQQWTMDAAFPVLERLPYCKVMIPCGFSGLYDPYYQSYFYFLPLVMKHYDHFIFHAGEYRDIDFFRQNGFTQLSIIPNGAAEDEFNVDHINFRQKYGIPEDVPLLLTVGSHTGIKGHSLAMRAFQRLNIEKGVLVIIGNVFSWGSHRELFYRPLMEYLKDLRFHTAAKIIIRALLGGIAPGCLPHCRMYSRWVNLTGLGKKKVLLLDPPRGDVVAAYHAADLFVFGSNLEYSPLVLFEASASRTPYVTLECGNAKEIAEWTGGGVVAPTFKLENGNVDGRPQIFAREIEGLLMDTQKRNQLAQRGYDSWRERFTWEKIVLQYEALYQELMK